VGAKKGTYTHKKAQTSSVAVYASRYSLCPTPKKANESPHCI